MANMLEIIDGCKRMEKRAQKSLYDLYSPVLMGIAMRYAKNREDAEDILQDAFVRIFTHIDQFSEGGSFEGWMRRILVNTAITYYRRNSKYLFHKDYEEIEEIREDENASGSLRNDYTSDELLYVMNKMPDGFRLVFNLFAIEGLKHKEIAEMLGIDVGTSKSQYHRARMFLQNNLVLLSRQKLTVDYE